MNESELLNALDADIIERFKRAVELGKWPDGKLLTAEQREICMQAVIVYEHRHLPEHLRTGYVPPKETVCSHEDDHEHPVKWQTQ